LYNDHNDHMNNLKDWFWRTFTLTPDTYSDPDAKDTADGQHAQYAGDTYAYVEWVMDGWANDLTKLWTSSGTGVWQGPAAKAFKGVYDTYTQYIADMRNTAGGYKDALHNHAWIAQNNAVAGFVSDWNHWLNVVKPQMDKVWEDFVHVPAAAFDRTFPGIQ